MRGHEHMLGNLTITLMTRKPKKEVCVYNSLQGTLQCELLPTRGSVLFHLVDGPWVAVVLPPANLHEVHQQELPGCTEGRGRRGKACEDRVLTHVFFVSHWALETRWTALSRAMALH